VLLVSTFLSLVGLSEGHILPDSFLAKLVQKNSSDVRKCLVELQWFCSWGMGDKFGGFNWTDVDGNWKKSDTTGWCDWRRCLNSSTLTPDPRNETSDIVFQEALNLSEIMSWTDAQCVESRADLVSVELMTGFEIYHNLVNSAILIRLFLSIHNLRSSESINWPLCRISTIEDISTSSRSNDTL
jgi:hypothetical protein